MYSQRQRNKLSVTVPDSIFIVLTIFWPTILRGSLLGKKTYIYGYNTSINGVTQLGIFQKQIETFSFFLTVSSFIFKRDSLPSNSFKFQFKIYHNFVGSTYRPTKYQRCWRQAKWSSDLINTTHVNQDNIQDAHKIISCTNIWTRTHNVQ